MRSTRFPLGRTLLAGALLLAPVLAMAQVPSMGIPGGSFSDLCSRTGLCAASSPTGIGLLSTFLFNLLNTIRIIFIGVCTAYAAWFGLMMIAKGHEENTLTEQKKAFGYASMGLGIVGVASYIAQTFAPSTTGGYIVNPAPFNAAANIVADYITMATGGFLVFTLSMSGFRLIVLQGDEGEVGKQKKNFFSGLIGIVVILLARVVVFSMVGAGGTGTTILVAEIAGIVKFLLEIIAGLAVLSLITAGFFFIISVEGDERKTSAKRMISSTVIILILVIASHSIIATFIR